MSYGRRSPDGCIVGCWCMIEQQSELALILLTPSGGRGLLRPVLA